jgi:hypothetical protein
MRPMIRPAASLALLLAAAAPLHADWLGFGCTAASGPAKTESRAVAPFHKIEFSGSGAMTLSPARDAAPAAGSAKAAIPGGGFDETTKQTEKRVNAPAAARAPAYALEFEGPANLLALYTSKVENDTLIIENKQCIRGDNPVKIRVSFDKLERLETSGTGNVRSAGKLSGDSLELATSGAAEIYLDLDVGSLKTGSSGASEMHLTGRAKSHSVDMSGAGELVAPKLEVEDYTIDISGAGNCEINASKNITLDVSGAGDIKLHGHPKILKQTFSGAGSLEMADKAI